jgi:hypothetical protein
MQVAWGCGWVSFEILWHPAVCAAAADGRPTWPVNASFSKPMSASTSSIPSPTLIARVFVFVINHYLALYDCRPLVAALRTVSAKQRLQRSCLLARPQHSTGLTQIC